MSIVLICICGIIDMMCVSHYNSKTLKDAMHIDELKKDNSTNIRIDFINSGLGSNSCGPDLLSKHRFKNKKVDFIFYIK